MLPELWSNKESLKKKKTFIAKQIFVLFKAKVFNDLQNYDAKTVPN